MVTRMNFGKRKSRRCVLLSDARVNGLVALCE